MKTASFVSYFKTLVELARIRNVFISFFGVCVGALLFSMGAPISQLNILVAAVSAGLILGGGNALNDYFDYEIDKINQPHRPIPSGRIRRNDVFMVSITFFLLGLGLSKSINDYCLGLAFLNTVILVLYAKYSKRLLLIANLTISYLVASVFVYGAMAAYSPMLWLNPDGIRLVIFIGVCSFFISLAREIIKDIEDVEGDSRAYSATLPIRYGADNAKKIAFSSACIAILFSFAPIVFPIIGFSEPLYGLFIIVTDVVIVFSFTRNPHLNQRLLVVGMTLALMAFLAGLSPTYMPRL